MSSTIRFSVPLPPSALRANSRSHWRTKAATKQRYSEEVLAAFWNSGDAATLWPKRRYGSNDAGPVPWEQAKVTFTWRACRLPDQANVLPSCKALLDILCMAPKSTQTNNTTSLGLIEDDKGVEAVGKVEKVATRAEECCVVEIEKL